LTPVKVDEAEAETKERDGNQIVNKWIV